MWPTNSEWSPQSCRAVTFAAIAALACANSGVLPAYSYLGSMPFDRSAGEMTDQGFLAARENVHAEMAGFHQESMHARFLATEITHNGGSSEPDMKRVRGHAADLAAHLRGDDGDARGERGHNPAEKILRYLAAGAGLDRRNFHC
jgi:hypothetical protein